MNSTCVMLDCEQSSNYSWSNLEMARNYWSTFFAGYFISLASVGSEFSSGETMVE